MATFNDADKPAGCMDNPLDFRGSDRTVFVVSSRIKPTRKAAGMTLRDLSEKTSLELTRVARYEKGQAMLLDHADRLARALKVSLVWLLG